MKKIKKNIPFVLWAIITLSGIAFFSLQNDPLILVTWIAFAFIVLMIFAIANI